MDQEKSPSFEEALSRLEEIVEEMESKGTTLDRSIELYKEGVTLSKICKETLEVAEKEITVLQQSMEGVFALAKLDAPRS
ncbi:MAG: exodeoxyribonuclease VII small subunit [Clostridiales bacterium]|jgi:exodeoxyribonuclease VII small subunit|nr:exodeoxyribonuclease VII small subunit [Clostridiales bacterium]MDR2751505.1 exodeoxyribonuclease VII small subunit [Clostridiales bacterium]